MHSERWENIHRIRDEYSTKRRLLLEYFIQILDFEKNSKEYGGKISGIKTTEISRQNNAILAQISDEG